jgi:hypothetical protein
MVLLGTVRSWWHPHPDGWRLRRNQSSQVRNSKAAIMWYQNIPTTWWSWPESYLVESLDFLWILKITRSSFRTPLLHVARQTTACQRAVQHLGPCPVWTEFPLNKILDLDKNFTGFDPEDLNSFIQIQSIYEGRTRCSWMRDLTWLSWSSAAGLSHPVPLTEPATG